VVTQFSISVFLLIALLLIGSQMNYMRSKNLGYDKDNIVMVPLRFDNASAKKELFRTELSRIPQIKDISFSTSSLNGDNWGTIMSLKDGNDPERQEVTTIMTDDHFCRMYGLHLKAGRLFEANDTNAVSQSVPEGQRFPKSVVNEKLVKALGFESNETALGKRFWIGMNGWRAEIVGVVQDFNTGSLHEQIKPALITQYMPFCDKAGIKIKTGSDIPKTIANINEAFRKVFPDLIFEFNFLDQQLDALYKTEARLYTLFKIFSVLAMLISCLGLWGLVTFAAQQRVKEIGIRKVLGASVPNIVTLITKDFILLVSIALIIASPLAYWSVNKWLQDFAFRINIDWKVFAIAGTMALLIALAAVSFQAIKAAIANPVKSLRTE
jgi:ABC-type antimicrobial peptide transport system permease subunit